MTNANPESGRAYAEHRDFDQVPTYTDEDFLRKIAAAAGLETLTESALVADLACGPGKLGQSLQGSHPQHRFLFVDISVEQIEKARQANPDPRNRFIIADIRRMPEVATELVDKAVARYTIKDLTWEEKVLTLQEIRRIIRPNGILVVADMVAPNCRVQRWLNQQHAMKQEYEWRNPEKEGECYIPTTHEWLGFLRQAGFSARVFDTHMSPVTTRQWVSGGQINEVQKSMLDEFVLNTSPKTKEAFNIHMEKDQKTGEDLVRIDYPLTIIVAAKK